MPQGDLSILPGSITTALNPVNRLFFLIVIGTIRRQDGRSDQLRIKISNVSGMPRAVELIEDLARPVSSLSSVGKKDLKVTSDQNILIVEFSEVEKLALNERTMKQSLEIT